MRTKAQKILLFGKSGQVGWELQRSLAPLGEVVAVDFDSTDFCGDFTNLAGVAETVRQVKPSIIVNAAAHTAVDKAESEPDLARTINALAPAVIANEAQKLGAWLVHYSTDYVFDGSGTQAWKESDTPSPLSVYGQTKWEGEQAVAANCARHLIFRTSWMYATHGINFAKTILQLSKERNTLNIIGDQIGAPTGADLLADITSLVLQRLLLQSNATRFVGIYHVAPSGYTSWYEYAAMLIEYARKAGVDIKTAQNAINKIATKDYPTLAKRPLNSKLDTLKIQTAFNLYLPPWQQGVVRMLTEII